MKKLVFCIVCLVSLLVGCESAKTGKGEPDYKKIASGYDYRVFSKIEKQQLPKYVVSLLSSTVAGVSLEGTSFKVDLDSLMASSLMKTGRFKLVDRNQINKVIDEQNFSLSGMTSEYIELGQLTNADFVLSVSLVSISSSQLDKVSYEEIQVEAVISVQMIDVVTGEIFFSNSSTKGIGSSRLILDANGNLIKGVKDLNNLAVKAVSNAVLNSVNSFKRRFGLVGTVLTVKDGVVQLDCGSEFGIKEQDVFAFVSVGDAVMHPATNDLITYDYEYLGEGLVIEVSGSTCKVALEPEIVDLVDRNISAIYMDK